MPNRDSKAETNADSGISLSLFPSASVEANPMLGEDGQFSVKIQKKNPKKNAKSYEFVTVQDIFDAITEKNINKFCREFKQALSVGIATRELMKSLGKADGVEIPDNILKMPSLTWIDD